MFVVGCGIGPTFPITTVSIQNAVLPWQLGTATALVNFMRALASAFLVALYGAMLFGGAEFTSSRLRAAEPILIPEAFATQHEPLPKSWRGREFKITIESTPTGESGVPQLRVAKSSGDRRADRIAVSYANFILQAKPDLRRQNATNMLTFPIVLDGGLPGGAPRT